jgi:hypothetical protein
VKGGSPTQFAKWAGSVGQDTIPETLNRKGNPEMTRKSPPTADPNERNSEIALFRYGLIAPLLFDPLAAGELEQALRQIAAKSYPIPYSTRTRVSVSTLRRYLKLYNGDKDHRSGGFDALRPKKRSDKGCPRAFSAQVI